LRERVLYVFTHLKHSQSAHFFTQNNVSMKNVLAGFSRHETFKVPEQALRPKQRNVHP
jgi:hypothetical protein